MQSVVSPDQQYWYLSGIRSHRTIERVDPSIKYTAMHVSNSYIRGKPIYRDKNNYRKRKKLRSARSESNSDLRSLNTGTDLHSKWPAPVGLGIG